MPAHRTGPPADSPGAQPLASGHFHPANYTFIDGLPGSQASRDETGLVAGIGVFAQDMRDYVYPFMRMTMDHDRNFGGGALQEMG